MLFQHRSGREDASRRPRTLDAESTGSMSREAVEVRQAFHVRPFRFVEDVLTNHSVQYGLHPERTPPIAVP